MRMLHNWFSNLKTQTKLMTGFAVVGVIIFIVGFLGVLGLLRLRDNLRTVYNDSTVALANVAASSSSLGLYHDAVLEAARARTKAEYELAVRPLSGLKDATLEPLRAYAGGKLRVSRSGRNEEKDLVALADTVSLYFRAAEGAISAFDDSFSQAIPAPTRTLMHDLGVLSVSTDVAARYAAATLRVREMVATAREVAKDLNDEGQGVAMDSTRILLIGALLAIALGVGFGYFVARLISRGVSHIAEVAMQAASGQLGARAQIRSRDELGQMAAAFNSMLDRLTSLVQTEEERDMLQRRLMEFLVMVSEVSKGDLTKRGEVTADMFGNLSDAFNLMLDRFSKLMGQVKKAASRVAESSTVMQDMAGQMVETSKKQEEEAIDTLTAVEGLAEAMRQVATTADASSESAQQTLSATEHGRLAVEDTVHGMQTIRTAVQRMSKQVKGLGDRSLEISQIVSTIRDIANQTNLLALNAAIEAAGAGEAGSRFAVVADQVRKLAENSAQSAREIAELVSVIQTETQAAVVGMEQETQAVESGSASALRSGQVFKEISEIAQRSAVLAHTIAEYSKQQTVATEGVSETIRQFAAGAVTTRKSADETRLTVEELAKLAEGLTRSVEQFKLTAA